MLSYQEAKAMAVDPSSVKQLIKILIGAAWLDGKVQPEEQAYLQRFAQTQGVAEDPELKPWLYGLRAVSTSECQTWVDEYLGESPTSERYQQLLEDLSGLIYSDGDVTSEEAKLLTQLQNHGTSGAASHQFGAVTEAIQKLYQRWIKG
ncbi:TerB family tellurite resistance protein [Synechococcales cyanobacterium C]|uniref:TerB family tellurite resistance protein n=1 Tax=Petrachloros mirabilis ULC683 TaxID=2781853 RepID=A0A8K2A072_9CYAN|nr:TerB family tellurite resistance protein [Petrachloros mirabilis]NCJ08565.1 TerB family tellurite resistance protein [Petrachloros mirabilis ULC683]